MPKLTKSLRKTARYNLGGIAAVLAFDTFTDAGLNALTLTRDAALITTLLTSGAATTASAVLTVTTAAGVQNGDAISGAGITAGTTVLSVSGNTLNLSAPASVPLSSALTATRPVPASFLGRVLTLALAAGHPVTRMEFDENEASYSDNTVIGANRFPKHSLGLKFSGRDDARNEVIQVLDLSRTTFLVKTASGECVLLGGQNGLISEKSDSGAGGKNEDFNGYDLVLSGAEREKAPVIPVAEFNRLAGLVPA